MTYQTRRKPHTGAENQARITTPKFVELADRKGRPVAFHGETSGIWRNSNVDKGEIREEFVLRKLILSQLSSIQDLADNPLIEMASVDFHSNGLMRVTIISSLNADWNSVDSLLEEIFPGMEYRGQSAYAENDEMYSIDFNGETLINLVMKKAPTVIEAEEEICHPDCMINVTKVQSFLEPWYVERIMREKG